VFAVDAGRDGVRVRFYDDFLGGEACEVRGTGAAHHPRRLCGVVDVYAQHAEAPRVQPFPASGVGRVDGSRVGIVADEERL
jgi:hypothetical protein